MAILNFEEAYQTMKIITENPYIYIYELLIFSGLPSLYISLLKQLNRLKHQNNKPFNEYAIQSA